MKRAINTKTIRLLSLALILFAAGGGAVRSFSETEGVDWIVIDNHEEISKLAQEKNRPVILFFSADWSEPSRKMIRSVWTDKKVVSLSKKYICVSVDVEKSPKIESRFKVGTYPTLIVTDPWGNPMFKKSGFISADSLVNYMAKFAANFAELAKLKENAEKGIASDQALRKLAESYYKMMDYARSNEYLNEILKSDKAKNDPKLREELLQKIALNELRMRNYEKALEAFETVMEQLADKELQAKITYGIFVAYIGMKKLDEAEKILKKLEKEFPDSHAAKQAKKILESLKKSQKKELTVKVIK